LSFFSAINFFFHFCHFLSFFLRQLALLISPIVLKITANFIAVGQAKKKQRFQQLFAQNGFCFETHMLDHDRNKSTNWGQHQQHLCPMNCQEVKPGYETLSSQINFSYLIALTMVVVVVVFEKNNPTQNENPLKINRKYSPVLLRSRKPKNNLTFV